jgi:D-aspartate ligase
LRYPREERIRRFIKGNGQNPTPVIANGSYCNSLGISRGLGVKGVKSIVIDHSPRPLAFWSKYALGLRCPDPSTEPSRLILFLEALGKELPYKGIFFITDDTYLQVISSARQALEKYFILPFSQPEEILKVMDKKYQYERAVENGFPVPIAYFIESEGDVNNALEEIPFPAILKCRGGVSEFHRELGHAFEITSRDEGIHRYEACKNYSVVIQEYIPGNDDQLYTLGSYLDKDSNPLGIFVGRKLIQVRPKIGSCRIGESLTDEEVVGEGIRLLRTMKFHGVSQLECKKDPRDGKFKLVEINARYWMWHSLATACGVNLAYIQYQDATGAKPNKTISNANHKMWRESLPAALLSINRVFSGDLSPRDFVRALSPTCVDGIFSFRDPKPGFVYLYKFIHLLAKATLAKVLGKVMERRKSG